MLSRIALFSLLCLSSQAMAISFADIAEQNKDSVVQILGQEKTSKISSQDLLKLNELLKSIDPTLVFPNPKKQQDRIGAGFFIDSNGTLLTNAHVVSNLSSIDIVSSQQKHYKAEILGQDARTDIAVLRVKLPEGVMSKVPSFGSLDRFRAGDPVMAMGHPLGLSYSLSAGIVSAKTRFLDDDDNYFPFIQVDAPLNPGNSGGPLFDQQGQVIGLNSQIYSQNQGGSMGIGFSLPIEYALEVAHELALHGQIQHGRMGVSVQELNDDLRQSLSLNKNTTGVLVSSIDSSVCAENQSIHLGDVLTTMNGQSPQSMQDFLFLVARSKPGSSMSLGLIRQGQSMVIPFTVCSDSSSASTSTTEPMQASSIFDQPLVQTSFDLVARDDSHDEWPSNVTHALKVIQSQQSELQPDDLILSVDLQPFHSQEEFNQLLLKHSMKTPVLFMVQTNDNASPHFLTVPLNLAVHPLSSSLKKKAKP